MPVPPSADRAALARERLAARARRASSLRRRVVAGALASFALAWGVIAFNGPMGSEATTTTASTGTMATATATASGTSSDQSTSSSDNASNTVTTAQS
jgi:hypothetical protein